MDSKKKKALEATGWKFGDAEDFLELTPAERQMVDLRVRISRAVRRLRKQHRMTQQELADKMQSSQSRVAKIESGSAEVSLDLMFSGLFAAGGDVAEVVTSVAGTGRAAASARQSSVRGKSAGIAGSPPHSGMGAKPAEKSKSKVAATQKLRASAPARKMR